MRREATLVECGSVTAALSLLLHARLPVHVRSALRSAFGMISKIALAFVCRFSWRASPIAALLLR